MMPSTSHEAASDDGLHVAIVMDGNGRWASRRGLPRRRGHEAGAHAVRGIVECAPALGVRLLTLYAFSADNWKRPPREVGALLALFRRYLETECARCEEQGVRLSVIGRRDRLPASLLRAIERTEHATRAGATMHLRIAIDYSGRAAIAEAARLAARSAQDVVSFRSLLAEAQHGGDARDVDLLIRTGGERRLSDFLLWECAYAELLFVRRPWPEFGTRDLEAAIHDFQSRQRRFGGLAPATAAG